MSPEVWIVLAGQNRILAMRNATGRNATGDPGGSVVARIAAASAARRQPDYTGEVGALLDAARSVIERTGRARVADIVAAAGLSNEAFYRHFPSKDALVGALIEDGAERVARSIARRMARESSPEGRVVRWAEGMLGQAHGSPAALTLAVMSNSSTLNSSMPSGSRGSRAPLAALLHEPFAELGSEHPSLDADLVTDAVLGNVAAHTHATTKPGGDEVTRIVRFCLSVPSLDDRSSSRSEIA